MDDAFERLGLPRRWSLQVGELASRYKAVARKVHPDRFAAGPPHEREAAERMQSMVNDAHAVLADDRHRAEHLVALLGGPSANQDGRTPCGFLIEVLEWNESLEDGTLEGRAIDAIADRGNHELATAGMALDAPNPDLTLVREHLNAAAHLAKLVERAEAVA